MEFSHIPVLCTETIEALNIRKDGIYIDGTAGGGGHASEVEKRLSGGRILMIDRDPDAIAVLEKRFEGKKDALIRHGRFSEMDQIANECGISEVDGVLLDIGVSSYQLDTAERGFSYHTDSPLDMRMSREGDSAKDLVNSLSQKELARILFTYGEEKCANRIADAILRAREKKPIETTSELAELVKGAVPAAVRRKEKHPARKTFQALRIAVNGELDELKTGLQAAFSLLKPGGRLAVITFHSLEDRIVKQQMNEWSKGCTCPPDFPVCVCGKRPQVRILCKGITAQDEELEENQRAHSARMRVCEKL